ncbi:MAG: PAS domain S-box protein, partial [Rhodocyclaceae bacterium]
MHKAKVRPPSSDFAALLRRQAEARLDLQPIEGSAQTLQDAHRLVHEFQVHQIELEIQNEELRRVQHELEASQAKYFDLYDLAPVGYLTIGEDGRIREANFLAAQLLGGERAALIARPFSAFILPEDQDRFHFLRQHLSNAPHRQVAELRLIGKPGGPLWVRVEAATSLPRNDQPPTLRVTLTDISTAKAAEIVLREQIDQEARLSKFAANAPGAIFQYRLQPDGSGALCYASAGIEALFGVTPRELASDASALLARIHPDDRAHLIGSREASLRSLSTWHDEHRAMHPEKGEIWVELRATPERDADGSVLWYGFVADITERRRAEDLTRDLAQTLEQRVTDRTAELTASTRELELFSYAVSHDLRSPLRALDGYSYLLVEEFAGLLGEAGCHYLHRIRLASQHLSNVIDDMLDLAKVSRQALNPTVVDLSAVGNQVEQALQLEGLHRNVEWIISGGLAVQADPALMSILLGHLLGNAWKFTGERERGRIELGGCLMDGTLTFFVRDNGAGFDMAYAQKLFQPFQRMHEPGRFAGTG